jgi:hypothetical protein
MSAITRVLSHSFRETKFDIDSLKTICLFCGVGLVASLFLITCGFDLNACFF